jgi:hypothetical protein
LFLAGLSLGVLENAKQHFLLVSLLFHPFQKFTYKIHSLCPLLHANSCIITTTIKVLN